MDINRILRALKFILPALSMPDQLVKSKERGELSELSNQVYSVLTGGKGRGSEHTALGILIATGLEVGQAIYSKPGIQATVDSVIMKISAGKPEETKYPEEVDKHAEEILALFNARSRNIQPERLAVDGVPGSGKSTLARVLAEKLGMKWQSLDHMNMDKPIDFSGSGVIYEHHRLLRTQDIDCFDAIIYIDEPVELSKEKILHRKRGGYLVDIMDYDKLKRVGEKAFSIASGKVYTISGSYLKVKIRPEKGYKCYENIEKKLQEEGIKASNMSKEQFIFLLTENNARDGFLAYVNANAYTKELLSGAATALFKIIDKKLR